MFAGTERPVRSTSVPRAFAGYVSINPSLSLALYTRVLNTCTHYRLRGRYGFYERRRASEGGRSDAFDTIYGEMRGQRGVEKGEEVEAGVDGAREVTK